MSIDPSTLLVLLAAAEPADRAIQPSARKRLSGWRLIRSTVRLLKVRMGGAAVPWKALPEFSEEEITVAERLWKRKARFLVDESLGKEVVEILRELGWNVKGCWEVGLHGHPDENVFAVAWRERRILLSKDRDFLNNRRFPEYRNPGVVILPDGPVDSGRFIEALRRLIHLFAPFSGAYEGTKIDLSGIDSFRITCRNAETGAVETQRYRIDIHGNILIWEDEDSGDEA